MRRTKAEAAETREAILDAAEIVFNSTGVNQSSMIQIAHQATVTRGAVYFHFKDKADIFKALLDRAKFTQEDILEQAAACDHPDPLHVLRESTIAAVQMFASDARQQSIFTIVHHRCEYVGEMSMMLERLRAVKTRLLGLFVRLLEIARAKYLLSPRWSPEGASQVLIAVIGGLLHEWTQSGKTFDLKLDGAKTVTAIIDSFSSVSMPAPTQ